MSRANDIEEIIARAAETQDQQLASELFLALDDHEIFYSIDIKDVDGKEQINTPLLELADGTYALVAYPSKGHPELWKQFAGAPWRTVLDLASKIPPVEWLIIKNTQGSSVPIRKTQIAAILGLLPNRKKLVDNVDSLIAESADHPRTEWLSTLQRRLVDRELFVRLTPQSVSDQPTLITSSAGGVDGLVQAYTTRSRSGYAYGGMTWSAIVEMVSKTPTLSGVQLINDNDDWAIINRSDLGLFPRGGADEL
ncbi:hypothetical protein [Mycobacteroides chelonae]|uniref:hypothetical protein n=1 Tax=Mycobacteroides chelonae TaxID=1774 RepID=UPI000992269A|nr:hypothetical protein [Mycobacteroides chelonae]